jgi:flagellar hook-associated protein 3 FlgL
MIARTGDVAQSNRLNSHLQNTQNHMRETQVAIATGKRAQRYSEIASETGLLLHARNSQRHAAAFVATNTTTTDRINTMDTALGNVLDIAERARTLLIQRLDPSLGGDVPLDSEIDSMLQEVAAQLNKRLGDRYLFAGSRTDTAPVELPDTINGPADLADIYRGDDVRLTVRAAEGVEISYGIPASDAFDLLNVLATVKEAHLAGDTAGLQASVDTLGGAVSSLTGLRGDLGARATRLEAITQTHQASAAYLAETVSRIEDTDLSSAMTSLAKDQAAIEAAYLTISRISSLSLADYLR